MSDKVYVVLKNGKLYRCFWSKREAFDMVEEMIEQQCWYKDDRFHIITL